jgi:hypothetical protein
MIAITFVVLLTTPRFFFQEPVHAKTDVNMRAHRTAKNADAILETTVIMENERLKIEYEFRNTSKVAIYLFNKLSTGDDDKGVWHVDPDLVYVIFSKGQGCLAKCLIPVPKHVLPAIPEIPLVTKVDSGKSFRETVSLPIPLKTSIPYGRKVPGDPVRLEAQFTWEVGYFKGTPITAKHERKVPTTMGTAVRFWSFDPAHQDILKTEPFPFRVPFKIIELPMEEEGENEGTVATGSLQSVAIVKEPG